VAKECSGLPLHATDPGYPKSSACPKPYFCALKIIVAKKKKKKKEREREQSGGRHHSQLI